MVLDAEGAEAPSGDGALAAALERQFLHAQATVASFDAVFQANGTRILQTAVRAPRMNATCERLLSILRRQLLDRVLILSEAHLRAVLIEYQTHDNTARPHQGIAQRVPGYECETPGVTAVNLDVQRIRRKSILNGLINEYSRAA